METIEEQMLPLKHHDGLCPEGKLKCHETVAGKLMFYLLTESKREAQLCSAPLCSNEKKSLTAVHFHELPQLWNLNVHNS